MNSIALLKMMLVPVAFLLMYCFYMSFSGIMVFKSKNKDSLRAARVKRDGELKTMIAEKNLFVFIFATIGSAMSLCLIYLITNTNAIFPRGSFFWKLSCLGLLLGIAACGFTVMVTIFKNLSWYLSETEKNKC
jgi:hypothetical protein